MSNYETVLDILVDMEVSIGDQLGDALVELRDSERWDNALAAAGVDNWDGYDYAQELYNAEV